MIRVCMEWVHKVLQCTLKYTADGRWTLHKEVKRYLTFSNQDLRSLFQQFPNFVTEMPFWQKPRSHSRLLICLLLSYFSLQRPVLFSMMNFFFWLCDCYFAICSSAGKYSVVVPMFWTEISYIDVDYLILHFYTVTPVFIYISRMHSLWGTGFLTAVQIAVIGCVLKDKFNTNYVRTLCAWFFFSSLWVCIDSRWEIQVG